jgi:hypothetical protein
MSISKQKRASPSQTAHDIAVVSLKISQIHLHDEIRRVQQAIDLPPLKMPLPMWLAERAKEEVAAVLSLTPPIVALQSKKWYCIGNVRAFQLARELARDESEEILCLSCNENRKERIAANYLRELFWQPALMGLRRKDVTPLAVAAEKAINQQMLAVPKKDKDGIAFVAALYGIDKRRLQNALSALASAKYAAPDTLLSFLDTP